MHGIRGDDYVNMLSYGFIYETLQIQPHCSQLPEYIMYDFIHEILWILRTCPDLIIKQPGTDIYILYIYKV